MTRIWLIGGTQESAQLVRMMAGHHIAVVVSVTTDSARSLYPELPSVKVRVGALDEAQISQFIHQQGVTAILDASHPYAANISTLAIAAAQAHGLPYLRYERPPAKAASTVEVDNIEAILSDDYLKGQRALLTVGYRFLPLFRPWQEQATLFTRILPSQVALETALEAGFTPDRIIALRPPLSASLEKALWQQWQISLVVTKASGVAGGELVKQQVAQSLDVTLVTVRRPSIAYPQQTSRLDEAIAFCDRHCALVPS
ncbi:MAG: cobalt-precorrin-6A reductase [Cyanobacteria bacterium P01_A01_bin.135]